MVNFYLQLNNRTFNVLAEEIYPPSTTKYQDFFFSKNSKSLQEVIFQISFKISSSFTLKSA